MFAVLMGGQLVAYGVVILMTFGLSGLFYMRGRGCRFWLLVWGSLLARDVLVWLAVAVALPAQAIALIAALLTACWRFGLVAAVSGLTACKSWRLPALYAVIASVFGFAVVLLLPHVSAGEAAGLSWAISMSDGLFLFGLFVLLARRRPTRLGRLLILCVLPLAFSDPLWSVLWQAGWISYAMAAVGASLGASVGVLSAAMGICIYVLSGITTESVTQLGYATLALDMSATYMEAEFERSNGRHRAHGGRPRSAERVTRAGTGAGTPE